MHCAQSLTHAPSVEILAEGHRMHCAGGGPPFSIPLALKRGFILQMI